MFIFIVKFQPKSAFLTNIQSKTRKKTHECY